MTLLVPNFKSHMLNRVAQGDMSIFEEDYDFTLTERTEYKNWNALIVAATKGNLNLVNRLIEIEAVIENAAARNNEALICAAANGHRQHT